MTDQLPESTPDGAGDVRVRRARDNWLTVAQVVFLIAAVAFSIWSLRTQWPDIARAMSRTTVAEFVLSLVALYVGLIAFGFMWLRVLRGFGYPLPWRRGLGIFYVGQLGRYIPGSVWSFGAQAAMARAVKVPPRTTVTAGLIGLGFSLATSAAVGLFAVGAGLLSIGIPAWSAILLGVLALAALVPPIVNFLGRKLAGKNGTLRLSWSDVAIIVVLLLVTWVMDGIALMILSHGFALSPSDWFARCAIMVGAYGLSYVVGVVIIFAPAGLGAREAALAFLLTPILGLAGAAAIAIVSRIPITIVDFTLALGSWLLARSKRPTSEPADPSAP